MCVFFNHLNLIFIFKTTLFRISMLLLIATAIMVACTQDQELTKSSESESKITPRSTLGDSVFQAHNDFILWILDNHYDSAVYYASDDVDVIEFLERKRYQYVGGTSNISSVVIANGELIFQGPYYVEGSGFVNNYGAFSASWYTNLYLVMDSVINAVEANASESNVMPIIARGKIRVNAISGLANKENLINTLTQLQYSMALAYDIEDEYLEEEVLSEKLSEQLSSTISCTESLSKNTLIFQNHFL